MKYGRRWSVGILAGGIGVATMVLPAGAAMAATGTSAAATIPSCDTSTTSTGSSTTITTITTTAGYSTTATTNVSLPNLTATATQVEGIVIDGSTTTVVYNQTVSPSGSAQNATLFSAAAAADSAAAPGSTVAAPSLISTSTVVSTPVLVSSTSGTPTLTTVSTVTIGPATIVYGTNGDDSCLLAEGAEDINTVVTDATPVTDSYQSTATTTTVYDVDATVAAVSTPPGSGPCTGHPGSGNNNPGSGNNNPGSGKGHLGHNSHGGWN
jgi:hypothetical protein